MSRIKPNINLTNPSLFAEEVNIPQGNSWWLTEFWEAHDKISKKVGKYTLASFSLNVQ